MKNNLFKVLMFVLAPFFVLAITFGGVLFQKNNKTPNSITQENNVEYHWSEAIASGFSVSDTGIYDVAETESVLIDLSKGVVPGSDTGATLTRTTIDGEEEMPTNMLRAELVGGQVEVVIRASGKDHYITASTDAEYVLGDLLTGGRTVVARGTKLYVADAKGSASLARTTLDGTNLATIAAYSTSDARVAVVESGTVTFENATYGVAKPASGDNTTATSGRAFYVRGKGTNVTFSNVTIQNFACSGSGGAIYIGQEGEVSLNNCSIIDNTATSVGGAIWMTNTSSVSGNQGRLFVYGTTNLSRNSSDSSGGAIGAGWNNGRPKVYLGYSKNGSGEAVKTLWTGSISNNTASAGGAIYSDGLIYMDSGTISSNTATTTYGGGVAGPYLTFSMSGGTISGNTASTYGGGVYVGDKSTSSITITGGTISGNTAANGGGLGSWHTISISGGTISGNTASSNGGAIYANNATLTITGGTINENTGGAIYFQGGVQNTWSDTKSYIFTFSGGTIGNASATSVADSTHYGNYGGGVQLQGGQAKMIMSGTALIAYNTYNGSSHGGAGVSVCNCAVFEMNGGTIRYNYSNKSGGGVYLVGSSTTQATITGGAISNNTAATNGGGICANNANCTLTVSGGTISGNTASSNGGGIYSSGTLTISDSTISNNSATSSDGGAVWLASTGTLNLSGGTFSGNSAGDDGGCLYLEGNSTITGGTFSNNNGHWGGAIFYRPATHTLSGATFTGNSATKNSGGSGGLGGAISNYGTLTIGSNTNINGNSAEYVGGGIFCQSGSSTTINAGSITSNSTSSTGGGIYCSGILTISGGTISGNSVGSTGNAIYNTGTCSVSGGKIEHGTGSGGQLIYNTGTFVISGGTYNSKAYCFDMNGGGTGYYQIDGNFTETHGSATFWISSESYLRVNCSLDKNYTMTKQNVTSIDDGDAASTYIAYSTNATYLTSAYNHITVSNRTSWQQLDNGTKKANYVTVASKTGTISYVMNNGSHVSGFDTGYTSSKNSQTKNTTYATRTGYTINTCSITTNSSGASSSLSGGTTSNGTLTIPAGAYGNITITYTWTAKTYTVTSGKSTYTNTLTVASSGTFDSGLSISWAAKSATGYTISLSHVKVYSGSSTSGTLLATYTSGTSATFTMNTSTGYYSSIYVYATHTMSANKYTVTLDKQSGSGGTSSVTATYAASMPGITVPTRAGYTFGGYYDSTGGSGTQYYKDTGVSARIWNKTSNTTLYAKWTANTYNIEFYLNGGATFDYVDQYYSPYGRSDSYVYSGTLTYDVTYNLSQFYPMADGGTLIGASRTGYTLSGWKPDGQDFSYSTAKYGTTSSAVTTAITSSTTIPANAYIKNLATEMPYQGECCLVAQWTANTYHIYYHNVNGTQTYDQMVTYGSSYTTMSSSSTYAGSTNQASFYRWSESSTSNTNVKSASASYTYTSTGNTNLYAIFYRTITLKGLYTTSEKVGISTSAYGQSYASVSTGSVASLSIYSFDSSKTIYFSETGGGTGVRLYRGTTYVGYFNYQGWGSYYSVSFDSAWNSTNTDYYTGGSALYKITFTKTGTGSVSPTSAYISAGSSISANGATLTVYPNQHVYATPGSGYLFSSWSKTSGTINANTTIRATFARGITPVCITGDTEVWTGLDGTTTKAKDLKKGDPIVAYDSATKKYYLTTVKQHYIQVNVNTVHKITFDDGSELNITPHHNLVTTTGLRSIEGYNALAIGDTVVGRFGNKKIVSIERDNTTYERVYNFMPAVGDAFVAGDTVIEREDPTVPLVSNIEYEPIKEKEAGTKIEDRNGIVGLANADVQDDEQHAETAWFDDKHRKLSKLGVELETADGDVDGLAV